MILLGLVINMGEMYRSRKSTLKRQELLIYETTVSMVSTKSDIVAHLSGSGFMS